MKKFNSRIGAELIIPVLLLLGGLFYMAITFRNWPGILITFLVMIFLGTLVFNTWYAVSKDKLRVKCGFIYDKTIEIDSIHKITETRDIFGAPATSIKRLLIQFNDADSVAVSPRNKRTFIAILKKINPAIEVIE